MTWNTYELQCEGKVKHKNPAEAWNRFEKQKNRFKRRPQRKRVTLYRCWYCHYWHVGGKK